MSPVDDSRACSALRIANPSSSSACPADLGNERVGLRQRFGPSGAHCVDDLVREVGSERVLDVVPPHEP